MNMDDLINHNDNDDTYRPWVEIDLVTATSLTLQGKNQRWVEPYDQLFQLSFCGETNELVMTCHGTQSKITITGRGLEALIELIGCKHVRTVTQWTDGDPPEELAHIVTDICVEAI